MPNITVNNIVSASGGGGNFIASTVSANWSAAGGVVAVINSNGLDSVNYGISSDGNAILSSNISANAVLSQHIGLDAVVSDKLSDNAIVHRAMNFNSSDSGVKVVQIGSAIANNGIALGRYSFAAVYTVTTAGTPANSASQRIVFSNTDQVLDGNPRFTSPPTPRGEILFSGANAGALNGPDMAQITALNSVSCDFVFRYFAAGTHSVTAHCEFWGPK